MDAERISFGWYMKMNKVRQALLLGCITLTLLAGCADPVRGPKGKASNGAEQQHKVVERICVPNSDKSAAMQIAEDVLGEMHFTIEKSDADPVRGPKGKASNGAEPGLIRTRPLAGAQFFEFWRNDSVGAFNWSEANLHSIRRTVELDISEQAGQVCIGCNVEVQRLSLPERQVSKGRAYEMFSESDASIQQLKLHSEQQQDMAWVDLGNDSKLGTEILKRIEKRTTTRSE